MNDSTPQALTRWCSASDANEAKAHGIPKQRSSLDEEGVQLLLEADHFGRVHKVAVVVAALLANLVQRGVVLVLRRIEATDKHVCKALDTSRRATTQCSVSGLLPVNDTCDQGVEGGGHEVRTRTEIPPLFLTYRGCRAAAG
jgi:hypothetical protein